MRKVTKEVCRAFIVGQKKTMGNTKTDGNALYLHGNMIAWKAEGKIHLSDCGWQTVTTKDRLNGVLDAIGGPFMLYQKNYQWYMWNGCDRVEWTGRYAI